MPICRFPAESGLLEDDLITTAFPPYRLRNIPGQALDYIAQYRQEWDDNKGMFKEKALHDFTSHAADEYRYAAVVEDQMTNEEPKPYNPPPQEPSSLYGG